MISHHRLLKNSVVIELEKTKLWFNDPVNARMTARIITLPDHTDYVIEREHVFSIPYNLLLLPDCCYVGNIEQVKVFEAIAQERKNQDDKWGENKPQSLPGFLIILESELDEAKKGWAKNLDGKSAPLNEIVQLAAVAVACLEKYGTKGSAISTNDIHNSEEK
jgi:hypothetical protein